MVCISGSVLSYLYSYELLHAPCNRSVGHTFVVHVTPWEDLGHFFTPTMLFYVVDVVYSIVTLQKLKKTLSKLRF